MRIRCWYCNKSVSTEVPDETVFGAVAQCPDCIAVDKGVYQSGKEEGRREAWQQHIQPNCQYRCRKSPSTEDYACRKRCDSPDSLCRECTADCVYEGCPRMQ